jgi:hypothetical protein
LNAYERYMDTFGKLNSVIKIADHSFITLDTVSLSAKQDSISKLNAQYFLDDLKEKYKYSKGSYNILLTHVPLYRGENVDCGPRRRTPNIKNHYGYQYQS